MKLLTGPRLAAYAIALFGGTACAQHDAALRDDTALRDEAPPPQSDVESKLDADDVRPALDLNALRGFYDECTGRIFPPIFDDLIDVTRIPDFLIHRFTKVDVAVSIPGPLPAPPTKDGREQTTLIKVVGGKEAPVLLVNSDVMVKSGRMKQSPGADFASALVLFDNTELGSLDEQQSALKKNGDLAKEGLVFEGRSPVGKSATRFISTADISNGRMVSASLAPVMPTSTQSNWLESVMITDKGVVQDPVRTYDPCTDAGDPDGVWTFKHLMTEMANEPRTGITPEDFTLEFLLNWLFPRTINSDAVADRPAMWNEVIEPWLIASGGLQLDLDKAPFRLLAIVNRLDLRKTSSGGGYFGGSGIPLNAGELRFVFGVVKPPKDKGACELMPFTTIFEYGVPIGGCFGVRDWAREWTKLNLFPAYGTNYRNQLASLTERVVVRDAAPSKGNGSALNQLRTNEIALASPWEMNEFTLTNEQAGNTPVDGMLQLHTVAQTPDDAVYSPTPNASISAFIDSIVPPVGQCVTNHVVPASFMGQPFLGGNALVGKGPASPPGTWFGDAPSTVTDEYICGRHQFSVNTCNGCHSCDTGTEFVHISPTSGIPAALSGFLTGTSVEDTQFPSDKTWTFADLDRRYVDLYNVANSLCFISPPLQVEMAEVILERFPDPVVDPAIAIDILNQAEREAIKRLPADANPDPAMSVMLAGVGEQDLMASH